MCENFLKDVPFRIGDLLTGFNDSIFVIMWIQRVGRCRSGIRRMCSHACIVIKGKGYHGGGSEGGVDESMTVWKGLLGAPKQRMS